MRDTPGYRQSPSTPRPITSQTPAGADGGRRDIEQRGRALTALPLCFPLEKDPCAESLDPPFSKTHHIGWTHAAFHSCFLQNCLIAPHQALHPVPRRQFPQNDEICGTCSLPYTRKDSTQSADVPPRTSPHGTSSPTSMIICHGNGMVDNLLRYYGDSLKYGN